MNRLVIPVGTTTIDVYDVDYIDKIYHNEEGLYGIRITFFSGAYRDVWYQYAGKRDSDFSNILRYL